MKVIRRLGITRAKIQKHRRGQRTVIVRFESKEQSGHIYDLKFRKSYSRRETYFSNKFTLFTLTGMIMILKQCP